MTTGKTIALTRQTFVGKVLIITFIYSLMGMIHNGKNSYGIYIVTNTRHTLSINNLKLLTLHLNSYMCLFHVMILKYREVYNLP